MRTAQLPDTLAPSRAPDGVDGPIDFWLTLGTPQSADVRGYRFVVEREDYTGDVHAHADRATATFVHEGTGTIVVDGIEHEARPGAMVWVPQGARHQFRGLSKGFVAWNFQFLDPARTEWLPADPPEDA